MIRPGTSLTKQKQKRAVAPKVAPGKKADVSKPELLELLDKCDYVGAIALLEFERKAREERPRLLMWLAYCYFHNGDYRKAVDAYEEAARDGGDSGIPVYQACCLFAMCEYEEAEALASGAPESSLRSRLLFLIAQKSNDEATMMAQHQAASESEEDQLGLAGVQFLSAHYQKAADIYKELLANNKEHLALNVYVAFCYYKLDFYDVALEVLQTYLACFPNSVAAVNLKACAHFQLYNGKAAEAELKVLQQASTGGNIFTEHDLLQHNLVVFRNGENAVQVLPRLLDIIPEARLNLVIHHLRKDEGTEAFALVQDLEPSAPREYILKGIVYATLGQRTGTKAHLTLAQQQLQLVGSSASECDTIPGRQCMASCFFLKKQFDDVLVYLKSIKPYFASDDDFNWNYGIALGSVGDWPEALEALLQVQNDKYHADFCYLSWLARSHIMNKDPAAAWDMYVRMETSSESFSLLHLVANDCYRMGQFYYACKAFDVLERLDPDPEFWEGKRGAAVGVFQLVMAGEETADRLQETVDLVRNANDSSADFMIDRVMKKWARENRVQLT